MVDAAVVSAQLRTKCPCTMETLSPSRAATESSAFTKCPVPSTIGILCDGSAVTPYRRILFANATRISVHVMSLTSLAMYLGPSNTSSVSVCWHQMHLGLWPDAPLNYARDPAPAVLEFPSQNLFFTLWTIVCGLIQSSHLHH